MPHRADLRTDHRQRAIRLIDRAVREQVRDDRTATDFAMLPRTLVRISVTGRPTVRFELSTARGELRDGIEAKGCKHGHILPHFYQTHLDQDLQVAVADGPPCRPLCADIPQYPPRIDGARAVRAVGGYA